MSNSKLDGYSWHIEYHTVDRKKGKAADCEYLDQKRECHNKDCPNYLAKCFDATHCSYRKKEAFKSAVGKSVCSLPLNTKVLHSHFGYGTITAFNKSTGQIRVKFKGCTRDYSYPDVFIHKDLFITDQLYKLVLHDSEVH